MLKKLFKINFLMITILLNFTHGESTRANRQKMILSLSKELNIKNIIIFQSSSSAIEGKTILFAKSLFQSKIYFSYLSAKEMNSLIRESATSKNVFLKSLVIALKENFNEEIFELISGNEMGAFRFLWLIWENKNWTMLENGYFYIPYNVQLFNVQEGVKRNASIVYEIYHPRIYSEVLCRMEVGFWSEDQKFYIAEKDMFKRRFDMNRTQLKIVFDGDYTHYYWLDFLSIIEKAMNIRFTLTTTASEVKQLQLGIKTEQVEMIVLPLYFDHTIQRQSSILGLILKEFCNLYILYDEMLEDHGITPFVRPFSKGLWIAVGLSIALSSICSFFLVYAKSKMGNKSVVSFTSSFYYPIESFANQCGAEEPQDRSIRIAMLTVRLTALFIVPAYSAFILTFILFPVINLPFTDVKGLVEGGTYKISFPKESLMHTWFNLTEDPWLKKANEKSFLEFDEMPETVFDANKEICKIKKKVAFVIAENSLFLIQCKIVKITQMMTGWKGCYLRKRSPYEKIFNRIFKMFFSTGTINKHEIIMRWRKIRHENFFLTNEQNDLKMENVVPILMLITWFYIISVIILFFEHFFKWGENVFTRKFVREF